MTPTDADIDALLYALAGRMREHCGLAYPPVCGPEHEAIRAACREVVLEWLANTAPEARR